MNYMTFWQKEPFISTQNDTIINVEPSKLKEVKIDSKTIIPDIGSIIYLNSNMYSVSYIITNPDTNDIDIYVCEVKDAARINSYITHYIKNNSNDNL